MQLLLLAVQLLLLAVLIFISGEYALADDPDPTVVEYRTAGSSFGPWNAWQEATLPPVDSIWNATTIEADQSTYVWVRHKSGPEACILTKPKEGSHPSPYWAAGRTIHANQHGQTAYFQPGFGTVVGASGRSCQGYGVSDCTGICW